jgi:glycosyltransferase involved in cell wall biosynthesis
MMKVMICAYAWLVFDPPILNLGRLLSERGHEVIALGIGRKQDNPFEEVNSKFTVFRTIPLRPSYLNSSVILPFRFAFNLCKMAVKYKPDFYVATNWNSFITAVIAKKLSKGRIIYYQLEYNDRSNSGLAVQPFKVRVMFYLEKAWIHEAEALFSAEPNRSRFMKCDYSLPFEPPAIYNAPLKASLPRVEKKPPEGKLRIVNLGSVCPETGIRILLLTLSTHKINSSLDIYGPVKSDFENEFQKLLNETKANGNDINYCGCIPYAAVPRLLQNYDVGIAFYQGNNMNQLYCSPSKLFEYMAAGLVVIASDLPSLREIVRPPELGLCIQHENTDEIIKAIEFLEKDRSAFWNIGNKARNAFLDIYNYENQSMPLLKLLETE